MTTFTFCRSYCWIHGTGYIRPHLQGKATGCYVDQAKINSVEVKDPCLPKRMKEKQRTEPEFVNM